MLEIARDDDSIDVRAAAFALLGDALVRMGDDDCEPDLVERIGALVLASASDDLGPSVVRRRAVEAVERSPGRAHARNDPGCISAWGRDAQAGALVAMGRSLEGRWRTIVCAALGSEITELWSKRPERSRHDRDVADVAELSELTLKRTLTFARRRSPPWADWRAGCDPCTAEPLQGSARGR